MSSCEEGRSLMVGSNEESTKRKGADEAKAAEAAPASSQHCVETSDQPHARRRAQSVASAHPSVETVVSKAKRAASTLWTLLHAQHCAVPRGCNHPGCKDAKLLHLHLKVCPAGDSFLCPTKHRGCEQGRKLLAHYKRCKSIRAKQVGQSNIRRDAVQQQLCLVCNLVARQARSALNIKPPGSSFALACAPSSAPTRTSSVPARKTSSRRIISSFMLDSSNRVVHVPSDPIMQMSSQKMMPPPPPRAKVLGESGTGYDSLSTRPTQAPAGTEVVAMPYPYFGNQHYDHQETKSVSFDAGVRERAHSASEAHYTLPPSNQQMQRPRSQSVGASLAEGAQAHAECDTIFEEGGGEFADPNMWNRSAP